MILIHLYSFIWILQSQFHGIRGESHVFFRAGLNATLTCEKRSNYPTITCSDVSWLFNPDSSHTVHRVRNGQVSEEHPGSRLSVNSDCSLNIHNVSAEDVGRYTCRLWDRTDMDSRVDLGVLSISVAPPGGSSNPEADVTVQCSVSRHEISCSQGRILWLDQNRKIVSQNSPNNCVSTLTLKRRDNRRFTCQYLNAKGTEFISAHYTPGVSPEDVVHLYTRAGDDVTLSCDGLRTQGPTCSDVNWLFYKRRNSNHIFKVAEGVIQDSGSSSLNSDCSLSLHNVTEEESGLFQCDHQSYTYESVHLNVLTVSPVDLNQTQDRNITLRCSLGTYDPRCERGDFHWFEQNQMVLPVRRTNCVSYLTVERESQHNRTFSCQFVESSGVKVSAETKLGGKKDTDPLKNSGDSDKEGNRNTSTYIIVGAVASLLVLLVVAAVVLFKIKSKSSARQTTEDTPDDPPTNQPADPVVDPESGVTYATINHKTPKSKKQVVVEDTVTYSAVSIKTTADCSNSAIYSTVNKTNERTNA